VAHDFNNLLTVIVGGLDMILRRPDDTARVKRLAEAALAAGQRGERLTRQLLAFSRNQELKLEVVDVGALLDQAEPLLRRAVGEAVTLTIRRDGGVRSRVDAAQFEAALLNLVVNASDATATGGEISIAVEPVTLAAGQVLDTAPGDYVRVAVSDTGAGMPPEILARVFEPFFTTKEVGKGTGLGLAQVYGFLRQCGGGVSIDSVEGRGTTVALYLPATDAPATAASAGTGASPAVRLEGVRVLLVEDDAAVREIAGGLLRDLGCAVTTAENGVSALETLEENVVFDLLMSDIVMPGGVSGVDLARSASAHRPDLAVLLTTGYAGDRMDVAPADLPWPVLRKPFQVDQLAEIASALLADRAPGAGEVSAAGG
jgi:CheY-like chemotaxis protein